jgi:lysophospholipase L1-like esterase
LWESAEVRTLGKWVAAVVVSLALAAGVVAWRSWQSTRTIVGFGFTSYTHTHEPFAHELFDEQAEYRSHGDPEIGAVFPDTSTTYVHVTDQARRTWTPPRPTVTVWFFGGSAMFGIGQRDEHTIPSEVARLAHADGIEMRAVNYGASAYTTWQEVKLYERKLRTEPRPDLVVFYDGINDYSVACSKVENGHPAASKGPNEGSKAPNCETRPGSMVADVAAWMSQWQEEARALGVPVVQFWQPDAFSIDPRPAALWRKLGLPADMSQRRDAEAAIRKAIDPPPVDLSDVFDGHREPLLFDYAHTNERGARIVAEAMWAKLRPMV